MPQRYFVTRHPGAIKWAQRNGLRARKIEMKDFDPQVVQPGDVVAGTLPIHLVAELNQRGAHYWHLTMDVPVDMRGRELTADDMDACGARLDEFRALGLGTRNDEMRTRETWGGHPESAAYPALHLCIATGQQLPNAAPIKLCAWDRVVIFASPKMADSATKLAAFVADEAERRGQPQSAQALHFTLPDGGSLRQLRAAVQAAILQLRRVFPQHQLVLNITGGLKLMTLAFADTLRGQARILYCDAERGVLESVEPEGEEAVALGPELDFANYMRVQGFWIDRGGVPALQYQKQMQARRAITATLALRLPKISPDLLAMIGAAPCRGLAAALHKLAADAANSARTEDDFFAAVQEANLLDDSRISPEGMVLIQHLKQARLLVKGTEVAAGARRQRFCFADASAARYLAGGYLEEFAWLSAMATGLPDTHIGLNAHLDPLKRRQGRHSDALNEVDVGVAWNSRLLLIECKAGRQLSTGEKAQPIVNKLVAVRNAVGGPLARAWVVGNTPLPAREEADIGARTQVGQISVYLKPSDLEQLPQFIANWAGLKTTPSIDWRAEVLPLNASKPQAKASPKASKVTVAAAV